MPARPPYLVLTPPPRAAKDEPLHPLSWLSRASSLSAPRSSSSGVGSASAEFLALGISPHSLAGFAQRAWRLWTTPANSQPAPVVIARISPAQAQAALRRSALGGFALQQLVVCAVVGLAALYAPVTAAMRDIASVWALAGGAAAQVAVVLALWFVDDPWPLLALFSLLHALLVAGIGAALDSTLPFVNYLYACWGLCALLLLFSRPKTASTELQDPAKAFLPWQLAALGASLWIALPAVLVVVFDWDTVLDLAVDALVGSLVLQLVLMGWFAWHATVILSVLEPEEAVYGVVHLNVDVVAAVLAGFVTLCAAVIDKCQRHDRDSEQSSESSNGPRLRP